MEYKFICVFSEEDRDKLLGLGFHLLKEDKGNSMYTFLTQNTMNFNDLGVRKFYLSDILTF